MTRTLLGVACALVLSGCHKKSPSPQFAEAQGLFSSLTDSKGDEAWADPDMDRVYTLCNSVTAKSSDFEAARKMMARIDEERAKRGQARPTPRPDTPEAPNWPDFPKPPEEVDAGEGEPTIAGIEVGGDFKGIRTRYGPCFAPTEAQVDVPTVGKLDGWQWTGAIGCPGSLKSAAGKVILEKDGKVFRILNKSDLIARTFEDPGDGGPLVQTSGPPPEVPDAGPPPAPPDAGTP